MKPTKTLSVKLPLETHKNFHEFCGRRGITANNQLRKWIDTKPSKSTSLLLFSMVGIPVGIYVNNKMKMYVEKRHPNYSQLKVDLISNTVGILAGGVVIYSILNLVNV